MDHKIVKLPAKAEQLCFNLCKHYCLQFGAIDMAITPEGDYVFFEINPSGQYLWIEDLTKAPISEAIAELLANPKKNRL
jgi:glutathione synthase/RimK-type ligase-like ATP-grasp enzyme